MLVLDYLNLFTQLLSPKTKKLQISLYIYIRGVFHIQNGISVEIISELEKVP